MARGTSVHAMPPPSIRAGGGGGGGGMESTVTIINNSGKIVNTGKQLVSLFKEVSNTYKDKKAELKLRRFLQRSALDQPAPNVPRTREIEPGAVPIGPGAYRPEDYGTAEYRLEDGRRARHAYDEQSVASSRRSHRSRHSTTNRSEHHRRRSTGQGLTENNLDRLSETSGTAPSARASGAYRSPYAETVQPGPATRVNGTDYERSIAPSEITQAASESLGMRGGLVLPQQQGQQIPPLQRQYLEEESLGSYNYGDDDDYDSDDMHLAYGSLPPDLEQRRDLDPVGPVGSIGPVDPVDEVAQAQSLVHKIEDLLDEVECMEHTATEMIKHLQERPDAAAAVALTLAQLSAFVGKLSPGFLSVLKGGSPAVFALLASPQFLIGTGIAVGVTVVMFGGWKIIQRATMTQQPLAFEANPAAGAGAGVGDGSGPAEARGYAQQQQQQQQQQSPADQAAASDEAEEALVLKRMEEELSTIETWRRGIVADSNWENESAEMELITPKAKSRRFWGRDKPKKDSHGRGEEKNKKEGRNGTDHGNDDEDDETKSHKSSRTHKSSRSSASHKQKPSVSSATHAREELYRHHTPHKHKDDAPHHQRHHSQQQQQQQHGHHQIQQQQQQQHASGDASRKSSSSRRADESASVASSNGTSKRSLSTKKPGSGSGSGSGRDHEDRGARGGSGGSNGGRGGDAVSKPKEKTTTMIKNLFKSKDKEKEKKEERQGDIISAS